MRTQPRAVKALVVSILLTFVALSTNSSLMSRASAYGQHAPIVIQGNSEFSAANGVIGGKGTRLNPYIISGWEIDSGLGDGIRIEQTDAYFIIRNVRVNSSAPNNNAGAGIHLVGIVNGRIDGSTISDNYQGVRLTGAAQTEISNSSLVGNGYGAVLVDVTSILVYGNAISHTSEDGVNSFNGTGISIVANTISIQHQGLSLTDSRAVRIQSNNISFSFNPAFDCYCPGIRLSSGRDIEVSNNSIHSNNIGILQDYVLANVSVVDNDIMDNFGPGIILEADNLTIMRNSVSWNGGVGISIGSVGGRIAANYVAFNNGDGVYVGGKGEVVSGNVIAGNAEYGIELFRATNTTLHANNLTENGIYIHGDFDPTPPLSNYNSHTIPPDNIVNGLPVYYYADREGVNVDGIPIGELIVVNSTRVTVSNLTMRPAEIGIEMFGVRDVTFLGDRIAGGRSIGIQVWRGQNVTLTQNEITSNYFLGLDMEEVTQVVIARNLVSGSGLLVGGGGIQVRGTDLAVVSNNVSEDGFGIAASGTNVIIEANNVSLNGGGIEACCTSVRVVGNNIVSSTFWQGLILGGTGGLVYHNNFIDNKIQLDIGSATLYSFDDGYPGGGNYWSDYVGSDDCRGPNQDQCPGPDGIGDIPYGPDRYPLMNPYGLANWPPGPSFTVSPSSGLAVTVFKVDASSSWDREDPTSLLDVRWDWDGDGTWDTPWSPNKTADHQYPTPGTYTIRLEAMDTGGLTGEKTAKVTVVAPLGLAIGASPGEGIAPLSVYLYANLTGGLAPYTYTWSFGDGGTDSFSAGTHTYPDPGDYAATLTVVDALGESATKSMTIIVREAFGLEIGADRLKGTVPLTVSFTATVAGGVEPYSLLWNFGDGEASRSPNPSHTYYDSGVFTVTLTATDPNGQKVTRTLQVMALSLNEVEPNRPILAGVLILAVTWSVVGAVFVLWRARRARGGLGKQ